MPIKSVPIFLAGIFILAATNAEPVLASTAHSSLRAYCFKQVGAYYNPARKTWRMFGGLSSPQWQNFYNCLDANTMKRR